MWTNYGPNRIKKKFKKKPKLNSKGKTNNICKSSCNTTNDMRIEIKNERRKKILTKKEKESEWIWNDDSQKCPQKKKKLWLVQQGDERSILVII